MVGACYTLASEGRCLGLIPQFDGQNCGIKPKVHASITHDNLVWHQLAMQTVMTLPMLSIRHSLATGGVLHQAGISLC